MLGRISDGFRGKGALGEDKDPIREGIPNRGGSRHQSTLKLTFSTGGSKSYSFSILAFLLNFVARAERSCSVLSFVNCSRIAVFAAANVCIPSGM